MKDTRLYELAKALVVASYYHDELAYYIRVEHEEIAAHGDDSVQAERAQETVDACADDRDAALAVFSRGDADALRAEMREVFEHLERRGSGYVRGLLRDNTPAELDDRDVFVVYEFVHHTDGRPYDARLKYVA